MQHVRANAMGAILKIAMAVQQHCVLDQVDDPGISMFHVLSPIEWLSGW